MLKGGFPVKVNRPSFLLNLQLDVERFGNGEEISQKGSNRMTNNIAEKFIGALTELESAREVEQIVALFADDCEVGNVVTERFRGLNGARKFWTNYRNTFKDVCSIFKNEFYSEKETVFEWTTVGKSKNGQKVNYQGISVLVTKGEKNHTLLCLLRPEKFAETNYQIPIRRRKPNRPLKNRQ